MNELLMQFGAEAVHVIVERPLECHDCGRSTSCLVNRDGRTRCYDCDAGHQDRKALWLAFGGGCGMTELLMQFEGGAAYVMAERLLECHDCGRSTSCVVNRDGRTRCYDCDAQHQDKRMRAAAAK